MPGERAQHPMADLKPTILTPEKEIHTNGGNCFMDTFSKGKSHRLPSIGPAPKGLAACVNTFDFSTL